MVPDLWSSRGDNQRSHQPPGRGPLVVHAARGSTTSKTLMLDRCQQNGDLRLLEVTEERNSPSGLRDDDEDDERRKHDVQLSLYQTMFVTLSYSNFCLN